MDIGEDVSIETLNCFIQYDLGRIYWVLFKEYEEKAIKKNFRRIAMEKKQPQQPQQPQRTNPNQKQNPQKQNPSIKNPNQKKGF